jgi:hypothetical protein
MEDYIQQLMAIERELYQELEKSDVFKRWQSIKSAVAVFKNGHAIPAVSSNGTLVTTPVPNSIPSVYSHELTWRQKLLFALRDLGKEVAVSTLVTYFQQKGETMEEEALIKRVGVTTSKLRSEGEIKIRLDGRKGFYSL